MTKIMVVQDEFSVGVDIQKILERYGYEVCAVLCSGEAALEKAKEKKPDLVLMDILLKSEMNGIETSKQLGKFYNIPVIFLTSYSNKEILEDVKVTEPFGYLVKPFKENDLIATIEMALYKAEKEKERKKLILELQKGSRQGKNLE